MEITSVQHQHQVMASNQPINMEEVLLASGKCEQNQERKARPQPEHALKCPRCESTNTKFCYYNNYSLSQPRYFCKGCRRYWTQGGSLRNVPVGGGCRKNKRSSSFNSSNKPQDHQQTLITTNSLPVLPELSYAPTTDGLSLYPFLNPNPSPNPSPNFLDILRTGFLDSASNPCSSYGFDGSLGLSCPTTTAAADGDQESKMVMGHQWEFRDGSNNTNNAGVDHHSARDYYNWHGIINSSLM